MQQSLAGASGDDINMVLRTYYNAATMAGTAQSIEGPRLRNLHLTDDVRRAVRTMIIYQARLLHNIARDLYMIRNTLLNCEVDAHVVDDIIFGAAAEGNVAPEQLVQPTQPCLPAFEAIHSGTLNLAHYVFP